MTIDINSAFSAVAKIAFNYLAYREGANYARRREFNEVRDYIRGNNLDLPTVPPTGIAVDERFVIQIFAHSAAPVLDTETPRGALEFRWSFVRLCDTLR